VTFINVVLRDFVEVAPLPSVLLHLPIALILFWLGLVILRLHILWIRVAFSILWSLQICRPKFSLVLVLKFLLDVDNISISCS
jgi:hypothetical protein